MARITDRIKLMDILKAKYPKMWMKDGTEWNHNSKADFIWTGENSYAVESWVDEETGKVETTDVNLFDYNAGSWDRHERKYVMGIYKELLTLLTEHGWYCEWHDGGTVFIYKIN